MNFLEKLDFMMDKLGINKSKLSSISGVPYTTIDTFYKKGYENTKLSTIRKLSDALNVSMDYLIVDTITDETYGKTNGFSLKSGEMDHIKKYRALDDYGKEAVDGVLDVEYRRCEAERRASSAVKIKEQRQEMELAKEAAQELVYFTVPRQIYPVGAGGGQYNDYQETENQRLIKEPPHGTSYIAPVAGDSMEPTYYEGDLLFIRATVDIRPGQIGIFFMGGQQWVKECGDGELISHNSAYDPEPFTEDVRCQGIVLGVCDDSYFEK